MCFVKCKSHIGLHKKMNTMSFLAHGLVSECSEVSNVEASPDTVTYGFANFLGSNDLGKVQGQNCFPVDCLQIIRTHKSRSHIFESSHRSWRMSSQLSCASTRQGPHLASKYKVGWGTWLVSTIFALFKSCHLGCGWY